jgi:hypothetical protein
MVEDQPAIQAPERMIAEKDKVAARDHYFGEVGRRLANRPNISCMGRDEQSLLPHFTAPPRQGSVVAPVKGTATFPRCGLCLLHATARYLASPLVAGMNVLAGYVVVIALT